MARHCTAGSLVTGVGMTLCAASLGLAGPITVGPNVHVSRGRSGDPHYEVLVAADPTHASRLLVGAIHRSAGAAQSSGTIAYVSYDGGETWTATLEAPPSDRSGDTSSDPALAYGADGTAFFLSSLLPPNSSGPTRRMLLYRSKDGGRTWAPPVYFTYSDREYLAVDSTRGPYHGRIYVNGNSRVGVTAGSLTTFYSTDGGETFTESVMPKLPPAPAMGNVVVQSDGTVVALYSADRGEGATKAPAGVRHAWLRVSRSEDGGKSFSQPVEVTEAMLVAGRKGAHNNTLNLPMMAGDESGGRFKDRLYVVWPDYRNGHTEIFLCRSADGGRTWSTPIQVSDTPAAREGFSAPDQFMANVAVNRHGVVGVVWYDRRDRPDNISWDVRFAASLDGGATFLPSVRVSERGTTFGPDNEWIIESRVSKPTGKPMAVDLALDTFTFLGGDTAGLAADATGVFHPVWVDSSTGMPQIWTAAVTVARDGTTGAMGAAPAPAKAAAPLDEVTDEVALELIDPEIDRATNVLTVRGRLRNTSARPLTGPLRIKVVNIRSELGEVVATHADNGAPGAGAQWDFVPVAGDLVEPGQATRLRTLTFRVSNVQPFQEGNRYRRGLVSLAVSVWGSRAGGNTAGLSAPRH